MPFFGRGRETHIAQTIVGLHSGSACVFVGDPGAGKSVLAREIATQFDTTVVAISPSERMWPSSGLSAVTAGLGGPRGAAVDGVLARGRDWPEHLLAEEVSRTLHLVRDEPRVLVIDDFDKMDSASLVVLSYVFSRLRGTGVSVIATIGSLHGRHDFAGMAHARIERLAFGESVDLARTVLGRGTSPAVLHLVAMFTGGDPGILSRVRLTPAEAVGDDPLPLPLRLVDDRDGQGRRGARGAHDPRVDAVLDLLSVGPVFAYDRLHEQAAETGVDIDQLIDDGLVEVHGELARMADPADRLRHHAALSPEERRRLHAHASAAHEGTYPATHDWHESFLDPAADHARLLSAAVDLARTGETTAAVEFAERALSGDVVAADRARGLVELGDALVLHGFDLLGRHYLRRAGVAHDPAVRVRGAIAGLRAGVTTDHVVDDEMVSSAAEQADPSEVERLFCESARLHLSRGEVATAVARLEQAALRGVASVETALLTCLVRELDTTSAPVASAGGDAGGDPVAIDPDAPIELATLAVSVRVLREEYALARRQIGALLNRTPRLAPMWRDRLLRILVMTETRGGDPAAVRDAVAAWRLEWLPGRTPDAATTLLLAGAAAIDPVDATAEELVARGHALCRREDSPALLPFFSALEGALALAQGRADDAVGILRAAREDAPGDDPALLRVDADLIEALWLSERRDEARRELARLESAATRRPRRWTTLALARSRAVCLSDQGGPDAFRAAEAVYRTDDAPLEHLRLLASRERCLPAAPRPSARPAEMAATRSRTLSPQEQEVVALLEQGLRNREIAAALFISLRTVELRLTGIYRKLGVSSRVHLVSLLHGAVMP